MFRSLDIVMFETMLPVQAISSCKQSLLSLFLLQNDFACPYVTFPTTHFLPFPVLCLILVICFPFNHYCLTSVRVMLSP